MTLEGIVLLAADTPRSQAYIQALISNDLYPECVIALGFGPVNEKAEEARPRKVEGVSLPDLRLSVAASCYHARIPILACSSLDINSDEVASALRKVQRIVIYSGLGGQIISERTLGLGPLFLHMHSGSLPDYRGSTTFYYSLLNNHLPAVSAIILDRTIDTGPIVAQRHYPLPPASISLDQLYEPAIRADLLVRVLREFQRTSTLPHLSNQEATQGNTYYVIHPVLKHLAILSLEERKDARA